jgi:DNA-binding MarR family transcriptional regulator/GNAT superfamily N-acetyltransferase
MLQSQVERLRSFNRTVTASIGALDDHFLGRDMPLGEARLLWEVGKAGVGVRELRARLGLDSGYLSRLLRSLERQGLVETGPDPTDARVRRIRLTPAGMDERSELDRRSDALALSVLEPLPEDDRERLATAMAEVERLIVRSQIVITQEPATSADVRWCFGQYFAELDRRFETGFDVGRSNRADPADLTPPAGLVLVARIRNDPVGCGAVKLHPDGVAELKRMWVSPRVRGQGLGGRMLRELEGHAAANGSTLVRLETNRSLREAIALYRRSGYVEVPAFNSEPYAHHWFEKRLAPPA